jgi:hypothetical protein
VDLVTVVGDDRVFPDFHGGNEMYLTAAAHQKIDIEAFPFVMHFYFVAHL